MFFAYILRSLRDGSFYYGSTHDLESRLAEHNAGRVRYTKGHRPYVIHYSEQFDRPSEAIVRENFFKMVTGYRWLKKEGII